MDLAEIYESLSLLVPSAKVRVMAEVGSTMDEAKTFFPLPGEKPADGIMGVVVSDIQTKGRGRQGRSWTSTSGHGVYLSCAYRLTLLDQSSLGLLPLLTGLELLKRFITISDKIRIKWPNDLLVKEQNALKKLGGILLEAFQDSDSINIVLGVGINHQNIDVPGAINIVDLAETKIDRAEVAHEIVLAIVKACLSLPNLELEKFISEYNSASLFFGEPVSFVDHRGSQISGKSLGIAPDGALLLEGARGEIKLYSGDVHQQI